MGRAARSTGFAWSEPHDRTSRHARVLFGIAIGVCALYVLAFVALVGLIVYEVDPDVWSGYHWSAATVAAGLAAGLALVSGAALAAVGVWRVAASRSWRLVRAGRPNAAQMNAVLPALTEFATPYGIAVPEVWVVADPAPNALVHGTATSGRVCFTTGAFSLDREELEALCLFQITALASRSFALCVATIDATLLAEWCTRLMWMTGIAGFLVGVVGAGRTVAAAYLIGIVVLVAITRLALMVTDRALPGLLTDACLLVDLETIRRSAEPAAHARLLVSLLEDQRRTRSRWEIAHRWFERDAVVLQGPSFGLGDELIDVTTDGIGVPPLVKRWERSSGRGLVGRSDTAINLANGDSRLRARFERVAATERR